MKSKILLWGVAATTAFCLALALAGPARADDDRGEPDFQMEIDPVMFVTLDSDELSFHPGFEQMMAGRSDPAALSATVSSNTDWALYLVGTAETFDGPWDKPCADILWRTAGGSDFAPLSTAPCEIGRGGPARACEVALEFAIVLDMERDRPGAYRYQNLVFQVSAL